MGALLELTLPSRELLNCVKDYNVFSYRLHQLDAIGQINGAVTLTFGVLNFHLAFSIIIVAAFSAIIITGALILPDGIVGIIEASTIRIPSNPQTFN